MWTALFKNGSTSSQYIKDAQGKFVEQSFRAVLDNVDELVSLAYVTKTQTFKIFLKDGMFELSSVGQPFKFYALSEEKTQALENIRPIYFIRETVKIGTESIAAGGKITSSPATVNFVALGFQANLNGQNVKRFLAIDPSGTFTMQDDV